MCVGGEGRLGESRGTWVYLHQEGKQERGGQLRVREAGTTPGSLG